jgi:predicted transcriptional regulator
MEATVRRRQHTMHPITHYWELVKDMDNSQKLELVTMLIDSVKPKVADDMTMEEMLEDYPYKRYTKAELNAMLDEAEADIAAGRVTDHEELMREWEEELAREEQEELKLQMTEAI